MKTESNFLYVESNNLLNTYTHTKRNSAQAMREWVGLSNKRFNFSTPSCIFYTTITFKKSPPVFISLCGFENSRNFLGASSTGILYTKCFRLTHHHQQPASTVIEMLIFYIVSYWLLFVWCGLIRCVYLMYVIKKRFVLLLAVYCAHREKLFECWFFLCNM